MHRILVVVEGFTERTIVEQTLAPHLGSCGVSLHAKVIGKPGHKGGIRNFETVRREILALLSQERGSHVSTFLDYYGLPDDWPGVQQAKGKKAQDIAGIVEAAMHNEVGGKMASSDNPSRFVPYVQMHELEALLFSDPKIMAEVFERPELETRFIQIRNECGECEEINDHATTAPSKRIEKLFPGYRKGKGTRSHAPIIVKRIGLDKLRRGCPHFGEWIKKLEDTGS